jgi:glycerophosphoryl diester phosphodiesterase
MRKTSSKIATGVGIAAGAVAATAAIVAPRRGDSYVDARWQRLRTHRYAHRGLHDVSLGIPENSLAAFQRAHDLGFGAELDVHLTVEGKLAVIHDSNTKRMCGTSLTVEKSTLAQLRDLTLAGTQEHIPTLDEVLELFEFDTSSDDPEPAPLIVEVKTASAGWARVAELCEKTMAALDAHTVSYCIESFDPRVLIWLRRHRPEVVRGQLSRDFLRDGDFGPETPRDFAGTVMLGNAFARPDFVAYKFADRKTPAVELVVRALGAKPVYWTIRAPEDLVECESEGGVAIFEGFVPVSCRAGEDAKPRA